MKIIESHLQGKTSPVPDDGGEDRIIVTDHYAAVIDGATAKTQLRYPLNGCDVTPGTMAAEIMKQGVMDLDPDMEPREVCDFLNQRVRDAYTERGILDRVEKNPSERFSAAIAVYNNKKRYVLQAGDIQLVMDGKYYHYDLQMSEERMALRVKEIERILASGDMTLEQYLSLPPDQCPGRLLAFNNPPADSGLYTARRDQNTYQNISGSPYGYFALDGFADYAVQGWDIIPVPDHVTDIVLASDGYATLEGIDPVQTLGTLAEAEAALKRVITEDPACFRLYKATKGMNRANFSFDDRSYLKLSITK